jgi:FkbM family methyltransferase
MIRAFKKIRHYYLAIGLYGVLVFIFAKVLRTHPLFKTKVPGIRHPVYLRIGTTDATVLRQVLIEKHYDIPRQVAPKAILDAGANIGFSAIFFANKYPDATIVALEPESSNFQLLQRNVSAYPQIKPLQAALWKENRQINLIDPNHGHHGFQTVEVTMNGCAQLGLVQALTVDAVMSRMGLSSVDLLKIDIEGAEKEVFESSAKWIDRVQMIMAELHDSIKPGCSKAFREATKVFTLESSNGEIIVRSRTEMKVSSNS